MKNSIEKFYPIPGEQEAQICISYVKSENRLDVQLGVSMGDWIVSRTSLVLGGEADEADINLALQALYECYIEIGDYKELLDYLKQQSHSLVCPCCECRKARQNNRSEVPEYCTNHSSN